MSIELSLIEHCAPTLASLKPASLFSIVSPCWHELEIQRSLLCSLLDDKGIGLRILRVSKERALCYLYRRDMLSAILEDKAVSDFLRSEGYTDCSLSAALDRLCMRLTANPDFPHEIGVFLGYPLSDVIAFIENHGQGCACCGCWKAYTNVCEAQRLFARFDKCRNVYRRLYTCGRPLAKLVVPCCA